MANNNEWGFTSPPCMVSNLFTPDDKPDIVYVSVEFMGGSVTIPCGRSVATTISERDMVQIVGVFTYKEKKGEKIIKFVGHEVKKATNRRTAESA